MRSHITHLDRAIARLLDERARLAVELSESGAGAAAGPLVSDLLRRADGDFPAEQLEAVFAAVDLGCRRAAERAR